MYGFFRDAAEEKVEEKVTEQVPGKLVFTSHNPHGNKGRRARLESAAIYAADVVGERAGLRKLNVDEVEELKTMFLQMADEPSKDSVHNVVTKLLHKYLLRFLEVVASGRSDKMTLEEAVSTIVGGPPLSLRSTSKHHFVSACITINKIVKRNFKIHMERYCKIIANITKDRE